MPAGRIISPAPLAYARRQGPDYGHARDQIMAMIEALQDPETQHFGCNFFFGGVPQGKATKSMRLFAKEVMPAFK